MEHTLRFLVVEFPSEDFVVTRFTRAHPLCVVDLVTEHPVRHGGGLVYPTVFLAKGVAWRELRVLLDEMARVHEPPEVLRRDAASLAWLCRVGMHPEHLGGDAQALARFQDRFGPPWIHVEQGVFHMRARLAETQDAELLVSLLTSFLEETGVQAQMEVRDLPARDYGVWEDLLRASADLAPWRRADA